MVDIEAYQHNGVFFTFSLALKYPGNNWSNVISFIQYYKICSDKNLLSRISLHVDLNFLGVFHEVEGNRTAGRLH